MSGRLLWPRSRADDVESGWLPEIEAPALTSSQVLGAIARRHPMDGWHGMPGRWVFVHEVSAMTGAYGGAQRFDAVAVGLVPSNRYARVIYEVKVSRGDWLRELRPTAQVTYRGTWGEQRIGGRRAEAIILNRAAFPEYEVVETRKWDAALAVSTEFWIAAPARCVLPHELPPEAGLIEVRPWGKDREPRARVVRPAPVRETPNPDPGFWAAVLRRAAGKGALPETDWEAAP